MKSIITLMCACAPVCMCVCVCALRVVFPSFQTRFPLYKYFYYLQALLHCYETRTPDVTAAGQMVRDIAWPFKAPILFCAMACADMTLDVAYHCHAM